MKTSYFFLVNTHLKLKFQIVLVLLILLPVNSCKTYSKKVSSSQPNNSLIQSAQHNSADQSPSLVTLKKLLAISHFQELNPLQTSTKGELKIEKQLLLRLYKLPSENNQCNDETHLVCSYQYYLSVSTYDEYPEFNVFNLPIKGEILEYKFQKSTEIDQSIISFKYTEYTQEALNQSKRKTLNLESIVKAITIFITPNKIKSQL